MCGQQEQLASHADADLLEDVRWGSTGQKRAHQLFVERSHDAVNQLAVAAGAGAADAVCAASAAVAAPAAALNTADALASGTAAVANLAAVSE